MKLKLVACSLVLLNSTMLFALDMPLRHIDGKIHNLTDFRGNWVIVNYWATWCGPCIAEMPDLQAFHDTHVNKGAMVIGINTEKLASDQLIDFLDTYFISYPIYQHELQSQSELGSIPGLPTTFLVSPSGKVEARQVGSITSEMIESFIQKWEAEHSGTQQN